MRQAPGMYIIYHCLITRYAAEIRPIGLLVTDPRKNAASAALYRRLFSHVLPYKGVFGVALFGMLLVAAGDTAFAWVLKPLMDQGFVGRDADFIRLVPLLLVAIALVRAIGDFVDVYCSNWVSRKVIQDLRQKMFEQLIEAPAEYFDRHSSGSLVSRLTYDVEQVARAGSDALRVLFRDILKAGFLLCLLFWLSWKLSLIFIAIFPLTFFIFRITGGRFRRISFVIQESVGNITDIAKQAFQGHKLVKIFNAQDYEKRAFFAANNRHRQQSMKKAGVLAATVPIVVFLMGVGMALMIWLALVLEITPGVFTSYLVAITMVVRPVRNLSRVNEVIQTGLAGVQSVFRTIDLYREKDEGRIILGDIDGNVSFSDVSFHYPGDRPRVLENIDFTIEAGSTVALVGPSGSGKSTIASMLMRFYSPTAGSIRIDGHLLQDIRLRSLRENIAMVSQEVILVADTIRNNIVYGRGGDIDEERFMTAVKTARIREFTDHFADGLDTFVGEEGSRLSGGQRQRIAIARALYKDAPILVLDEATSSLDSRSEKHIQDAISHLIRNRTTLVIAHRLSTIENADLILALDKGRIVERGRHQALLSKRGHYYRLYNAQYRQNAVHTG